VSKIFATEMAERVCSNAHPGSWWAGIYPQMAIREVFKECKSPRSMMAEMANVVMYKS